MKILLSLLLLEAISINCIGQSAIDTQSVKRVIYQFQDDFNEGSFKNSGVYTTSDWEHINPGGGIDKGRNKVLKTVRTVHQTFLKGVSMTVESMSIRFATRDVAIANVIHKVSDYTTPDGVKHENERQIKTYILVKQKGLWLLTHDQNTIIADSHLSVSEK